MLQNMMLRDFVRQGVVRRTLAADDAELLSRLEAFNLKEIARWDRDLGA